MKRWISALAVSAFALSLTAPALAFQANPAPAKRPGAAARAQRNQMPRGLQAALAKLNLNEEQKTKIKAAADAFRAEARKIREGSGTPQEKREKIRAAQRTFREKLNGILTPEQQKQLREELAKARQARRAAGQGAGSSASKPAKP